MQQTLQQNVTVLPGGRLELECPELNAGETVEVTIRRRLPDKQRRSALEILAEAPGQRLFKTAEEVKAYLDEEKASWER